MSKSVVSQILLITSLFLICAFAYPFALWVVARGVFPDQAEGSLLRDEQGNVRGSRTIAQDFPDARWFQARPSAVNYDASASGGSNFGVNNPLLRSRAARATGALVRFRDESLHGDVSVADAILKWYGEKSDRFVIWSQRYPSTAAQWRKEKTNDDVWKTWAETTGAADPSEFPTEFVRRMPGQFPAVVNQQIAACRDNAESAPWLFEYWLQEHPELATELTLVPVDAVTTSGSGLDPHITRSNAFSQRPRVVRAWSERTHKSVEEIDAVIDEILNARMERVLWGLTNDEPFVNVVTLNWEIQRRLEITADLKNSQTP